MIFPVVPSVHGDPASEEELKSALSEKQEIAEEKQKILKRLSRKERTLYKNLASIEDRMARLQRDISKQQRELSSISAEVQELEKKYNRLDSQRDSTQQNLNNLLQALWPLHISGFQSQLSSIATWDKADRHFTWLDTLYSMTEDNIQDLKKQAGELETNLEKQKQLKKRVQAKFEQVESTKDRLLKDKLSFLKQVQQVRAQKLRSEEQLQSVLQTIDSMQFELKAIDSRSFKIFQGRLPWPAQGRIISNFHPKASPPRRGVGIALSEGATVRAVSWGKVVHNDQLRGFGNVVIIYHGDDYYTLYAFLAQSHVKMGQKVEKEDPLGKAGYYPKAHGPGVYFELRFGKKAVNPTKWLVSSR